jgi:hypothetical protein
MTLEDLDESLPNGLHDARIKSLMHNYEDAIVKLEVEILVGLPADGLQNRDRYRDGAIVFHGVQFCVVGAPENERILGQAHSIWFTFDRIEPGLLPDKIAASLPPETLAYTLYILDWEAQIHIAGADVSFAWTGADQAFAA